MSASWLLSQSTPGSQRSSAIQDVIDNRLQRNAVARSADEHTNRSAHDGLGLIIPSVLKPPAFDMTAEG
jgi:hypothetical protein